MANRRFVDLVEYTKTHDTRFVKETQLIITRITYNTSFEVRLHMDMSAANLAEAMKTIIDGSVQVKQQLERGKRENKAQDRELARQPGTATLLKQEFAIEEEHIFEIAAKTVALLHPDGDEETKALLVETLLPPLVELQRGAELEFVSPLAFMPLNHRIHTKSNSPENFIYYDDAVYCTAGEAARTLSEKLGRPIAINYIRKLARRKKHPVRTQSMGDRLLYRLDDVEHATIRKKKSRKEEDDDI